jgi:hypothetical protein
MQRSSGKVRQDSSMTKDERITRYAKTNWRRIIVYMTTMAVFSAALYFGVSDRVEEKVVKRQGEPCRDLAKGPRIEPSEGCRVRARLYAEVCRREPKTCSGFFSALQASRTGRRAIRRAVAERRKTSSERRGEPEVASNAPSVGSESAPDSTTVPIATPTAGSAPPGPPGPPGPQGPPGPSGPSTSSTSQSTVANTIQHVLADPVTAATNPSEPVNELGCSVGLACPILPQP